MILSAAYPARTAGAAGLKKRLVQDNWDGVEGLRTLNRTFTIPYDHSGSAWESYLPAYGDPLVEPSLSFMLFESFTLKETACGSAELTLTYEQSEPDPGADPPTLPDDEVIESSTVEEIDIAAHPKFSTVNAAWGNHSMEEFWDGALHRFPITFPPNSNGPAGAPFQLADGTALPDALKGLQSYIVGTGQLRVVTYSLTRPSGWIASLAGRRTAPPTGYPGTAANWLILSGDISPQNGGTYFAKSLVYQYSEKDWDSFLYDAV